MSANGSKTKLEFTVPGVDVQLVYLDATMSLTHSGDVEITEHPLEDGANIADGARAKQSTLQLEAVVSDQPFIPPTSQEAPAGPGRARYVYSVLARVRDASGVIRLTTDLAVYENMLIKQLSAPQAVNLGRAVKFTLQFTQVKFVRSQTVALKRVKTTKAQEKQKDGAKSTTPTPEPVKKQTKFQQFASFATQAITGKK